MRDHARKGVEFHYSWILGRAGYRQLARNDDAFCCVFWSKDISALRQYGGVMIGRLTGCLLFSLRFDPKRSLNHASGIL